MIAGRASTMGHRAWGMAEAKVVEEDMGAEARVNHRHPIDSVAIDLSRFEFGVTIHLVMC
jgi:hypothetical protein